MAGPEHHCHGCGVDVAESKEPVVRVREGSFKTTPAGNPSWKDHGGIWGVMHRSCFLMAIGDPDGVTAMAAAAQASA